MAVIIPNSIRNAWNSAFDELFESRLGSLDITAVLVNLVDIVDADALPFLAKQFDVLGNKGWSLANTVEKQRQLIRNAVELHRYKGTPWSIKAALERIGYPGAQIQEGVGEIYYYDGTRTHNGSFTYGSAGHWAYFKVLFNLLDFTTAIPAVDLPLITKMILEYKNVRSHLFALAFTLDITDTLTSSDELEMEIQNTLSDPLGAVYNGQFAYNGGITYSGTMFDEFTVNII
jgi:P2-related tail formation protein